MFKNKYSFYKVKYTNISNNNKVKVKGSQIIFVLFLAASYPPPLIITTGINNNQKTKKLQYNHGGVCCVDGICSGNDARKIK